MGIGGDQRDGDHLSLGLQVDFEPKKNTFWVRKKTRSYSV